jgi:hypothetical protein
MYFELESFVDTLQVACAGLKMHHAWAIFASTEDYLSIFPHMTQLWQVILTLLASIASCERGFSTPNTYKRLRLPTLYCLEPYPAV